MDKHIEERLRAVEDQLKQFSEAVDALGRDLKRPVSAVRDGYYEAALTNAGSIIEAMLRDIWAKEKISGKADAKTIEQLFSVVKEQAEMDRLAQDYVRDIQLVRNRAAHGEQIVVEDCIECLRKLAVVLDWYFNKYVAVVGGGDESPDKVQKVSTSKLPLRKLAWIVTGVVVLLGVASLGIFLVRQKRAADSQTLVVHFGKEAPKSAPAGHLYLPKLKYSKDYKENIDWYYKHYNSREQVSASDFWKTYKIRGGESFRQVCRNYLEYLSSMGGKKPDAPKLASILKSEATTDQNMFIGESVNLRLTNCDLKDALYFFGLATSLQVVVHPSISGKVTLATDAPWDQTLVSLLEDNDLRMFSGGPVLYFYPSTAGGLEAGKKGLDPYFLPIAGIDIEKARMLASSVLTPPSSVTISPNQRFLFGLARPGEIQMAIQLLKNEGCSYDRWMDRSKTSVEDIYGIVLSGREPITVSRPSFFMLFYDSHYFVGKPISVNIEASPDFDMRNAFTVFHDISKMTFVLPPDCTPKYGLKVKDCPWDLAFNLLCKVNDLDYLFESNRVITYPAGAEKVATFRRARGGIRSTCDPETVAAFLSQLGLTTFQVSQVPGGGMAFSANDEEDLQYAQQVATVLEAFLCASEPAFKPRLAYYFEKNGKYDEAAEAYQSGVDKNPGSWDAFYYRLRRAIVLIKNGKKEDSNKYIRAWVKTLQGNEWPIPLAKYYAGEIDENELLKAAESRDPVKWKNQHLDVWYCLGMKKLLDGDNVKAKEYFEKCVSTGLKDFEEYSRAKDELEKLSK